MPVGLRPPWVKISPFAGRYLFGVDGDDDALAAEFLRPLTHETAILHRGGIDRDLVGAGEQELADIVGRTYPAADGQRHEAGFRGAAHHVEDDAAVLMRCGDVEETQFVGARFVIGFSDFNRVARIAQIDEIHSL